MGISYDPDNSSYKVSSLGRVTTTKVTTSGDIVTKWIKSANKNLHRRDSPRFKRIVSIDVKSNSRGDEDDGRNPIAVLTHCAGWHCLIFQISKRNSIPDSLSSFLSDELLQFIGVEIDRTKDWLQHDYNLVLENVENIEANVTATIEQDKPEVGDCNWEDDPLSLEQIECATIDALFSYKAGKNVD